MDIKLNRITTFGWMILLVVLLTGCTSIKNIKNAQSRSVSSDSYALIIGNSKYKNDIAWPNLRKVANDAEAVSNALKKQGYQIYLDKPLQNVETKAEFIETVLDFVKFVPSGSKIIIYYSGHGGSIKDIYDNYLFPTDISIPSNDNAVSVNDIINILNSKNSEGNNVLFLDACRNSTSDLDNYENRMNPLFLNDQQPRFRNTFVGYSSGFGKRSYEGEDTDGNTSVYTTELIRAIERTPNIEIDNLHAKVSKNVEKVTADKWQGWSESRIQVPDQEGYTAETCIGECKRNIPTSVWVGLGVVAAAILANGSSSGNPENISLQLPQLPNQ